MAATWRLVVPWMRVSAQRRSQRSRYAWASSRLRVTHAGLDLALRQSCRMLLVLLKHHRFGITHPFHPLRGACFPFVVTKFLWGEDRVTVQRPDGTVWSIPVGWTDFAPPEPAVVAGRGRAPFRLEDLRRLAEMPPCRGLSRRCASTPSSTFRLSRSSTPRP